MSRIGAGKTILVIDDDRDLLPSLVETIQAFSDFTVVTADNGVTALERFFEVHPDCVMVDVRMPGLDGYQLVRMLRGDAQTASVPLIILTALAREQNRFVGLASGADQYLVKPVRPKALMEAIRNALAASPEERARRLSGLADSEPPQPDDAETKPEPKRSGSSEG